MSLHAEREGERSNEVFGVSGGENRQREGGERTRGEYNADLIGGGGRHEDGGLLWRHDLPHLKVVEQWTNNKRQDSY